MLKNTQQGYTLVEMSIVVVIMALVVGVVHTAAVLVRASEVRSVVAQVEDFKSSVAAFELKYNALPGDMDFADQIWPGETVSGDGDRIINYRVGTQPGFNEDLRAWQHLSLARIMPGEFSGRLERGRLLTGVNIPASRIDQTGYRFVQPTYTVYGRRGNAFILGLAGYSFISGAIFKSLEAWQIDTKMDDGIAYSGFVSSINGYSQVGGRGFRQGTECVTDPINSKNSYYTFDDEKEICTIHFWYDGAIDFSRGGFPGF